LKKIYTGKTKDVFLKEDGNIVLRFKDSVTGSEGVIDSGANEVIGEVAGKGYASLRTTIYFFDLLKEAGIPTHYIGRGEQYGHGADTIVVKRARSYNIEVICREKAWGSFVRRYGSYVKQGTVLPTLVEFTLKDDQRGDPLITEDALAALGIVTAEAVRYMKNTARQATAVIKLHLAQKGLELIDIKYEFGEVDGRTVIIDEVSGDSMRVAKDGRVLLQKELYAELFGEEL
jgi:phosphoribosylaminoimidazole-succinocarboxamide synthase